ncbi:MAG: acetate--CoA ligase family protein [Syntrophales bacterium]|nr:acetate--CoA ligase family protein [Syntrophales bacterium]MDD5532660.1 acetate--CoA ligase family protein [Syntrophales bacterium]
MRLFFEPESVVVIGAPRKTGPGALNNIEMMLRYGYKGRVYPINPNADAICGIKAFPSVSEVPETPDLAVISVGRDRVLPMLRQCVDKGIRRAVVITQGFSDADSIGAELQRQIVELAHATGMRIVGPNTMGVINHYKHFTTAFVDRPFPEKFPPVSLIAQTGFIQVAPREIAYGEWGKAIDTGNTSDVDFVDALNYFNDDPETRIICIHMEGMNRGREFLKAAAATTLKKPVLAIKTGRSRAGARAALSHSGSLVGEDDVFNAAFRRAGIIRVKTLLELRDSIHALLRLEEMKGPRMCVLTVTGAGGIMCADAAEDYGLELSSLPKGLPEKLKQGMPDWIHVGNPIDIWPIGMIGGNYTRVFGETLKDLLVADEVDGVMCIFPVSVSALHQDLNLLQAVEEARQQTGSRKPISAWTYMDSDLFRDKFESIERVGNFDSIDQAVQGLGFALRATRNRERRAPEPKVFPYDAEKVRSLMGTDGVLAGEKALELLACFGIPAPESRLVSSAVEAVAAGKEIGYPLVLKLAGPAFLHKSEWGGVVPGIRNRRDLEKALRDVEKSVRRKDSRARIDSWLVQEQAEGKEILMGLKLDPQFGHVIACGLGGIYTEVFRDVSREIVPIGRGEAEWMLKSLRMYPLLQGARGERPVDIEVLIDILQRLSFMATVLPGIREMDINPVMASAEKCVAVDARIIFE